MNNTIAELRRLLDIIDEYGLYYFFKRISSKIIKPRIKKVKYIKQLFTDKSGIEIGGPSVIFRDKGFIPIYKVLKNLDGCNFSNSTIWEGNIKTETKYNYYKEGKGVQYISEATDLSSIEDSKYEFIISSNCLEHVANPLKAVKEWIRVIKEDGLILLILPNKKYCFDHNRNVTEFSHLLDDYKNNTKEDDLAHIDEILKFHDLKKDKTAGSFEEFKARSLDNLNNRALHQHIFDLDLLKQIYQYFELEILATHEGEEYILLGRKILKRN